ncbi:MAG: hypothetical protein VCB26_14695 [Candidatus Hydrogenedentota bacterium]
MSVGHDVVGGDRQVVGVGELVDGFPASGWAVDSGIVLSGDGEALHGWGAF